MNLKFVGFLSCPNDATPLAKNITVVEVMSTSTLTGNRTWASHTLADDYTPGASS